MYWTRELGVAAPRAMLCALCVLKGFLCGVLLSKQPPVAKLHGMLCILDKFSQERSSLKRLQFASRALDEVEV